MLIGLMWQSFHNVCVLSFSVVSDSLQFHGLLPSRLLCLWNFPYKNNGVGCHFLLHSQCIHIINHFVTYFKYIQFLFVNYGWKKVEKIPIFLFLLSCLSNI